MRRCPKGCGRAHRRRGDPDARGADQLRRRARLGADRNAADRAVGVWDAVWSAGADLGREPFGYRALDALRMEKGYRYYGTDLTMLDTPDEAGLGRFVRLEKGPFIGRDALDTARRHATGVGGEPARRLITVFIGEDDEWRPVYGGEAVRVDGRVVGRLRSVAYGPCLGRTIATVYRGREVA